MKTIQLKKPENNLQVVHQHEIIALKKEVADLKRMVHSFREIPTEMSKPVIEKNPTLQVYTSEGYKFLNTKNILYGRANGNYVELFIAIKSEAAHPSGKKSFVLSKTIKTISTELPCEQFIRCHQSYLVNLNHVVGYENKGGMSIHLIDGARIPVSRRNKKFVTERLNASKNGRMLEDMDNNFG